MSKRSRQQSQAQRRLAEVRRQQQRQQMRVRALIGGALLAVVAVVAVVLALTLGGGTPKSSAASHGMAQGATVDGIQCQTTEQAAYHIHVHLAIFVNGAGRTVPLGIGIPQAQVQNGFAGGGKCLYWLHTHDGTGIIHIESPVHRNYTLGQFFDIWGRTLSTSRVGNDSGRVTVFVNGQRFSGDPRSIVLTARKVIQLDVGTVVPPKPYRFAAGL